MRRRHELSEAEWARLQPLLPPRKAGKPRQDDRRIINEARRYAQEQRISPDRFEFQMLYGVRRDLQEQLVREGYRMRVYVPFGTQWYPYLMRRLAERPANVAFITGNVVREMMSGRGRRGGSGARR